MEDNDDKLWITVRGVLAVLTLRMAIDDDNDTTGVVKKYYISKEEAQRRINILKTYPPDVRYSDSVLQEIFKEG